MCNINAWTQLALKLPHFFKSQKYIPWENSQWDSLDQTQKQLCHLTTCLPPHSSPFHNQSTILSTI